MNRRRWAAISVGTICMVSILVGPVGASASSVSITALWLGDSYTSGWGQPGNTGTCQRSPEAWPFTTMGLLRDSGINVTSYNFVACGGARTSQITSERALGQKADLVGFSFGGDDVGFAGTLATCIVGNLGTALTQEVSGLPIGAGGCPTDSAVRQNIEGQLAASYGGYENFLKFVASDYVVAGGNMVVIGYPALIEEESRWDTIDSVIRLCNGLNSNDAYLMRGWAGLLNQEIGEAVSQFDRLPAASRQNVTATFVNVQDGGSASHADSQYYYDPAGTTVGHNLCGSDPWITSWSDWDNFKLGWPPATPTGFHPTVEGSAATGTLAALAIESMSWSGLNASAPAPSSPTPNRGGGSESRSSLGGSTAPQPPPAKGNVALTQGSKATYGYWYDVAVHGWSSGESVSVTCSDTKDPNGFRSFSLITDSSGSASTSNECFSANGPQYWVEADGVRSAAISWSTPAATPPPPPPPPPPTTTTTTTTLSNSGSRPTTATTTTTTTTVPPPSQTWGFTIQDIYYGGTWARTDPNNGTWYTHANPPPNGAYWYPNGLGVAVNCVVQGASYTVRMGSSYSTWSWWGHVTDGKYVPIAVFSSVNDDGDQGLPHC